MEKASGGSFARTTRKTATKDDDEDDWEMTLNTYKAWAMLSWPFGPGPSGGKTGAKQIQRFNAGAPIPKQMG